MIVGAGLAGLTAACCLHTAGVSVELVEAGTRTGGRIHSMPGHGDLGPSWIWPPYQPVAARWARALDVPLLAQFETGEAIVQRHRNAPVERQILPGQHGMTRLEGGPQALVDRLLEQLPMTSIHLDEPVTRIAINDSGVDVYSSTNGRWGAGARHTRSPRTASMVIIATPPRLAASIEFSPQLPGSLRSLLSSTPTWMAAQAKVVIRYETAFWREMGLSGRIASQIGPLVEVHDHSGKDGEPAALSGFVGVDAATRTSMGASLDVAIVGQLVQCFGARAARLSALHVEDWALNPYVCTAEDARHPGPHPTVMTSEIRQPHLQDRLYMAGSETAGISPGLIEGALHAGETTAAMVLEAMQRTPFRAAAQKQD